MVQFYVAKDTYLGGGPSAAGDPPQPGAETR
jgi:hypothetical protein